jgi:AraC-like DNA-binding protein
MGEHISSSDSDDLIVGVQISGEGSISQDGRNGMIDGGSFCVLDPRRPFDTKLITRTRSVIVQVPRQRLEVRVGSITSLTARIMGGRKPISALASGFLGMLPSCNGTLDGIAESKIAEQALDLVALALSQEAELRPLALSSPRACTLLRLKCAIEARLADPDLKPTTVAEAVGISVRYANALLSAENTSLERCILQRRLERCRSALDDPVHAQRSIGDIAFGWGFSDLSHFGRRFKSAFGSAPSEYRRRQG